MDDTDDWKTLYLGDWSESMKVKAEALNAALAVYARGYERGGEVDLDRLSEFITLKLKEVARLQAAFDDTDEYVSGSRADV